MYSPGIENVKKAQEVKTRSKTKAIIKGLMLVRIFYSEPVGVTKAPAT